MVEEGSGANVIVLLQLPEHPFAFETETEYVPAAVTVMQEVVAPVFHK